MTLLSELWQFHHMIGGLRPFARRQKFTTRRWVARLIRLRNLRHFLLRRRMARQFAAAENRRIPQDVGFLNATGFDDFAVAAAIEQCRVILAKEDLAAAVARERPESRQFGSVALQGHLDLASPIMRLALHPKLIKIIANYIGMLPVLWDIRILYSPNTATFSNSSQYFHLDAADLNFILLTIPIEDVDDDSGPLVAVSAAATERIAKKIGYKMSATTLRVPDEVVLANIDPHRDLHKATGPAGSVFLLDTDRCFHYGSRAGSRPRLLLAIQYSTPFSFMLPNEWWKKLPFAPWASGGKIDRATRLVLGAPQ